MNRSTGALVLAGVAALVLVLLVVTSREEPASAPRREVVQETPQSCLDALDLAEEGFQAAGEALELVPGLLDLISEAYETGTRGDGTDQIVTELEKINATLDPLAQEAGPRADRFNKVKQACRSAA